MKELVEATLLLEGELRERELFEIGEKLFRLMHRGCRWVVLDFFDVPHLDYRGVRSLVARAELFRRAGGDLKLSGLSPYLWEILRAGGGHDAFDCYARPSEAQAAIARERRAGARPSPVPVPMPPAGARPRLAAVGA